jgi:hypothetical protein
MKIELTKDGKSKFNMLCEPDSNVDVPEYEKDFILNEQRHYWIVMIGEIQNALVDYTMANLPFRATCLIMHTPMKWNYWHFSIRWLTKQGFWHTLTTNEKEKVTKRLGNEARAHLMKYARLQAPVIKVLHSSCYEK